MFEYESKDIDEKKLEDMLRQAPQLPYRLDVPGENIESPLPYGQADT